MLLVRNLSRNSRECCVRSRNSRIYLMKRYKSHRNFEIILRLRLVLNAILNRKNDSYVSLIYEISLISEISDDRSLVEASRPRPRSFRLRWTFNRIMMNSGSWSTLVRHNVFTIKHVWWLASSDCMLVRGYGVQARCILATRSVLVNLSSRLDSVK